MNSRTKGKLGERDWRDALRASGVRFNDADIGAEWIGGCLKNNGSGKRYVVCWTARPNRRHEYLHRIVAQAGKGDWVDHANGDSLDNRPENLRHCTARENARNRSAQKNNKVGLKGVIWNRQCRKFQARINIGGQVIHLGLFPEARAAAAAYQTASRRHFGEFHHVN